MADLDNFFAKKDKKKGTKKFSKANPDVIAQKLERTARKEQMQQEMARDINNMVEQRAEEVAQEDDEEWEQYRVKDFTGLKIEKLVMEEKEIGPETGEEGSGGKAAASKASCLTAGCSGTMAGSSSCGLPRSAASRKCARSKS